VEFLIIIMIIIINTAKCELIGYSDFVVDDPLLRSFTRVQPCDVTLLGAPLFQGKVLNDFWSDRCSSLSRAVDRLCLVELILLRASFSSAPRVQHLLRCSPSVDMCGPQKFDDLLKSALSQLWLQARLPIRFGGLPIRFGGLVSDK